ncbi:MAG: hypothetical protein ACRD4I_15325, partial [Candidatus Angelobacter sp.]
VYIAGFSFISDFCALAGAAQTPNIATANIAAKILHNFPLLIFCSPDLARCSFGQIVIGVANSGPIIHVTEFLGRKKSYGK